jgi:hypothetical protein
VTNEWLAQLASAAAELDRIKNQFQPGKCQALRSLLEEPRHALSARPPLSRQEGMPIRSF